MYIYIGQTGIHYKILILLFHYVIAIVRVKLKVNALELKRKLFFELTDRIVNQSRTKFLSFLFLNSLNFHRI